MSKAKSAPSSHDGDVLGTPAAGLEIAKKPTRPLIFISHDHRDAPLAEAFSNLLTDASGGFLKSFRSSDRKGNAGIEFGTEWYSEIMTKISSATDVVALLTLRSIDRPWILYEAGVAKGKLDKPVFGVVVGVPFQDAIRGPFSQFQNCSDDEDSLTKLVLQLIKRNSDAEPREEAVRRQVAAFRQSIKQFSSSKAEVEKAPAPKDVEANAVAKLFEEIKVMFRDLPERLQTLLVESVAPRISRRRRMHPMMVMDLAHSFEDFGDRALGWLVLISSLREDAPWLYELGVEVYQAARSGDRKRVAMALDRFEHCMQSLMHSRIGRHMIDGPELDMLVHELPHLAKHLLLEGAEGHPAKPAIKPKDEGIRA